MKRLRQIFGFSSIKNILFWVPTHSQTRTAEQPYSRNTQQNTQQNSQQNTGKQQNTQQNSLVNTQPNSRIPSRKAEHTAELTTEHTTEQTAHSKTRRTHSQTHSRTHSRTHNRTAELTAEHTDDAGDFPFYFETKETLCCSKKDKKTIKKYIIFFLKNFSVSVVGTPQLSYLCDLQQGGNKYPSESLQKRRRKRWDLQIWVKNE